MKANELTNELAQAITKSIPGSSFMDSNEILWKWVDGEFIGKPCVQTKDLSHKWLEEVTPDQIDTRYYNIDGSKLT